MRKKHKHCLRFRQAKEKETGKTYTVHTFRRDEGLVTTIGAAIRIWYWTHWSSTAHLSLMISYRRLPPHNNHRKYHPCICSCNLPPRSHIRFLQNTLIIKDTKMCVYHCLRGYGALRSLSRFLLGWSFCMSRLSLFCLFGLVLRACFCCLRCWARLRPFLFFCRSSNVESIRMRNMNMTLKIFMVRWVKYSVMKLIRCFKYFVHYHGK